MIGAIAGDMIGSAYERDPVKHKRFPLFVNESCFTDDTVLTVAVADVLLHGGDYAEAFRRYYARYPDAGYGGFFHQWARTPDAPAYNSFGNGSAMRVSAVGWAFDEFAQVLTEAKRSAEVTHDHPEGIIGAQAVAAAVFLARTGSSKADIKRYIEGEFYDLSGTVDEIRRTYKFDVTCQGSVPQALVCFLDSTDVEDAIRTAVSLGGDSDTQACIAGAVAHAFYREMPAHIEEEVMKRLDPELTGVVKEFAAKYVS